MDNQELKRHVLELWRGIPRAMHAAVSGHPGGSLSVTEVLTLPYFEELHVDPKNPEDSKRDRFVLSKGYCVPGLYAAFVAGGFFPEEDLLTLRHIDSYLQDHPDMEHIPGVDMPSGPLDQGIPAVVGVVLAAKTYGESYCTYALLGDGEIEEGEVWEAAMSVGLQKLDNLVVIVDNNSLQIGGPTDEVNSPYSVGKKFEAFNFHVISVEDDNGFDQLCAAFAEARNTKGCPTAIVMKTVKSKGIPFMESQVGWHGKGPNDEELAKALAKLDKTEEML